MKKYLLLFFVIFSTTLVKSQVAKEKVTISYSNETISEIFVRLEQMTAVKFYYYEDWINKEKISGNFNNSLLRTIISKLLEDTNINFHITKDNNVILTRNSVVYDFLPDGAFELVNKDSIAAALIEEKKKSKFPVYFSSQQSYQTAIQTTRIGKARKDSDKEKFELIGFVKDLKTNKPLNEVSITVDGLSTGTTSNKDGLFYITLPSGENIIQLRYLGYESITTRIIIYNDGEANFELIEEIQQLDEVILEGEVNKNVKEIITGLTVIDVKSIKNIPLVLGERDILKVALTLPGISTAGEGSTGYNVRGGKIDQNLILLDEATIYNPTHFFGLFSALNPFVIGEVNIYKGHIPSEFGGRLSSVFDIKTKTSSVKKLTGEVAIGPITSTFSIETPVIKEKSTLIIGGRGAYSNWILRSLDHKELSKSRASFYDVIAKYEHKVNKKNTLKVTGYYSYDNFSITSDSLYSYKNRLLSLKWNHSFNKKNSGSVRIANSAYSFNINYDGKTINDFDLGHKLEETELKINMKYFHNKELSFNYGLSSKLYNISPGNKIPKGDESIVSALRIPKERAIESGLYLSGKYNLNEKLSFNLGIRYAHYSFLGAINQNIYLDNLPKTTKTIKETLSFDKNKVVESYGGPEYRLSARYFVLPNTSIKASYNNMYQFIHTLSNNTTASPIDTWKLSDLNIKPQKSKQFSFGVFNNFNENLYEVSLEAYYKKTENILDYKIGAQLLLNEVIETEVLQGEGKAYGIEFLIKKKEGRLNGWVGYTYSRSLIKLDSEFPEEVVNNGKYFNSNFDKPHDFSLVSNYKFTKRFSASMNFAYQTGRPVTYPIGRYIQNGLELVAYSNRNEFRIPDYFRLDLSFNIEGNHRVKKIGHSFWNISIYNVLGRNNPFSVFFVTEGGKLKAKQSSIFSIPIPTITYNIKF
ncbi:MAG: TonB-dependent receptor [Cellulophaga sp.]